MALEPSHVDWQVLLRYHHACHQKLHLNLHLNTSIAVLLSMLPELRKVQDATGT